MYRFSFLVLGLIVGGVLMSNLHGVSAQFIDDFIDSYDLATDPTNGECLTTDGTNNIWSSSCGGGSGTPGGSNTQVQFNNSGSFAGDSGFTYSSSTDILSVVSINATNSTTTRLAVTGTGTSTFAGGINTGANMIISHGQQADASDGWYLNAGNGTNVGLFGAGNTANSLFYGGVNIDGNTRIATTTNGVLTATAGAITASGTPYVTSIVATGTTATSTFAGAVGIGTTTPLSILTVQGTANVTSNFQVNGGTLFVDATNNRVGIGTTTPVNQMSIVSSAVRTPYISFFDHLGNRAIDIISATSSTASSTAFGLESLQSVTTATGLTAFGSGALRANTTAGNNTAVGAWALKGATSGGNNSAFGFETLQALTSGVSNTAFGGNALRQTSTGARNIGIGYQSLYANTTGASNIAIGTIAGRYLADGATANVNSTSSIYLGHDIRSASAGALNEIVIGNYLTGNGTNTATYGSSAISSLFAGKVGIGTTTPTTPLSVTGDSIVTATSSVQSKLFVGTRGAGTANGPWSSGAGLGNIVSSCENCGASGSNLLTIANFGTGDAGVNTFSARGTTASPTATQSGDNLYFMGGRGYGSSAWGDSSKVVINMEASQTWTNSAQGTQISLETTPNNSTTRASRMTIANEGNVGIGTTTPVGKLSVVGTSGSSILQLLSDTGTKFMEVLNTGVTTLLGTWDFSGATVKQHTYKSFSFPTFATTTSATTTIDLGTAYTAESWSGADCYTSSGSGAFIFTDGTNRMNGDTATTTVSRTTLSTNNTFTAQEKRYVEVGPLTNAKLVCTVDVIVNN